MLTGMSNAIKKNITNVNTDGLSVATAWIRALNDERVVREKAGFLFKVSFDGDHLMLAVAPVLIEGVRNYHYDLQLEREDAFTLIGDVSATGVFTILFKPENCEAIAQHNSEYIEQFRRFAALLRLTGYTGVGRLNDVTQGLLKDLGLSPPPEILADFL